MKEKKHQSASHLLYGKNECCKFSAAVLQLSNYLFVYLKTERLLHISRVSFVAFLYVLQSSMLLFLFDKREQFNSVPELSQDVKSRRSWYR